MVFNNMSGHATEECVLCIVSEKQGFFCPFKCEKLLVKADPPPSPPSTSTSITLAWENHTGMSLRDTAAQINKLPPLQVCAGADNG